MIDIASLLVSAPATGALPPALAAGGARFALTFAELVDPAPTDAIDAPVLPDARQNLADDGSDLPTEDVPSGLQTAPDVFFMPLPAPAVEAAPPYDAPVSPDGANIASAIATAVDAAVVNASRTATPPSATNPGTLPVAAPPPLAAPVAFPSAPPADDATPTLRHSFGHRAPATPADVRPVGAGATQPAPDDISPTRVVVSTTASAPVALGATAAPIVIPVTTAAPVGTTLAAGSAIFAVPPLVKASRTATPPSASNPGTLPLAAPPPLAAPVAFPSALPADDATPTLRHSFGHRAPATPADVRPVGAGATQPAPDDISPARVVVNTTAAAPVVVGATAAPIVIPVTTAAPVGATLAAGSAIFTVPPPFSEPAPPGVTATPRFLPDIETVVVDAGRRTTRDIAPVRVASGPESQPEAPVIQPAGRAFAAAIAASIGSRPRPLARDERGDSAVATPVTTTPVELTTRAAVQPTTDTRHPALDLRQERGLQGMIDRIELLRDDTNARDTRIRLVPDALGGVDIAVRKDGDTLHVHFTADNRATATLLAEAQPKLADLAEARGVKLGQTSIATGTGPHHGDPGGNARREQDARQPGAPARAARPTNEPQSDHRIA